MDQVISKKDAKAQGLKFYFTGKPCKRGHISRRKISGGCEECVQQYLKDWHAARPNYNHNYNIAWRARDPEGYNQRQLRWSKNNPKNRAAVLKRYNSKPLPRLVNCLRSRLNQAIKSSAKHGSAIRDLGCSIQEFRDYISGLFTGNMTWENWGRVWELDHIRPLMSFDLSDRSQILEACHYTNLQPLTKTDHRLKTREQLKSFDT